MHVALGVRTNRFPIDTFVSAPGKKNVTIEAAAEPGKGGSAPLTFSSNRLVCLPQFHVKGPRHLLRQLRSVTLSRLVSLS